MSGCCLNRGEKKSGIIKIHVGLGLGSPQKNGEERNQHIYEDDFFLTIKVEDMNFERSSIVALTGSPWDLAGHTVHELFS